MDAALAQQLQRAGVEVAVEVGALDGGVRILRGERIFGIGGDCLLAHIGRVGERDVKAAPSEYLGEQDAPIRHALRRGCVAERAAKFALGSLDFVR